MRPSCCTPAGLGAGLALGWVLGVGKSGSSDSLLTEGDGATTGEEDVSFGISDSPPDRVRRFFAGCCES
eukprot:1623653-Rhodomonas_salina.2